MYKIPAGVIDLFSDAECEDSDFTNASLIVVEGIGAYKAIKPKPSSLPLLVAATTSNENQERRYWQNKFLGKNLTPQAIKTICFDIIDDKIPAEATADIATELAKWGTARSYHSITSLAAITAQYWRRIRAQLALSGVQNPMLLPTMHTLLDVSEIVLTKNMDQKELDKFNAEIYQPDLIRRMKNKPPAGFSPQELEANRKALMQACT